MAYAFALHFLLGSFSVLNALELSFFYYFPRRIQLTLVDPRTDIFVWAISAACVSILAIWLWKDSRTKGVQAVISLMTITIVPFLLLGPSTDPLHKIAVYLLFTVGTVNFGYNARAPEISLGLPKSIFRSRVLVYVLVTFMAIEISSAVHYVLRAFDPMTSVGRIDAGIELQLSYVSNGLLPWLYVAFLFSWAWVPIAYRVMSKARIFGSGSKTAPLRSFSMLAGSSADSRLKALLDPRVLALLAVAIFIGYYPYFQNPPWLVGTDAYWRYCDPLLRMNAQAVMDGFVKALGERHALALVLLYTAQIFLHVSPFDVVRFAPLLLVIVLALATWWFVARRKTMGFGLTVAAFSILSVTTTVGMFSSIIANWMALVVWMIFFAYTAFRLDERFRVLDAVVLLLMSTLILLIHPWTWGVFAASVALFAFVTLFQERRKGVRAAALLLSIIAIDAILALAGLAVLGESQGWRLAETFGLYTRVVGNPASVLVFWDALTRLTQVWAAFFSPVSIVVSILGVFCLQKANLSQWRRRLILCWLCASAIGSILVAPIGWNPAYPTRGESQLWRMLFLTPFQLTLPFGAALIAGFPKRLGKTSEPAHVEVSRASVRGALLAVVFMTGFLLAWTPMQLRLVPIILVLPAVVGLLLVKSGSQEKELVGTLALVSLLLVAFNYATRGLVQLLIDPHNYTP